MNPLPFILDGGLKLALGKVPTWLYAGAAVVALCGTGVWLHSRAVSATYNKGYAAGVLANEQSHIRAQAEADAQAQRINAQEKAKNDEANRRIAGVADAQRVHGPGKAVCPGSAATGSSAGRYVPPAGTGPASMADLPDDGRSDLIALPFPDTVSVIEQCALNRAEALSWRQADQAQRAAADKSTEGATKK